MKQWITRNAFADSSDTETSKDYKRPDGYWNWEKIEAVKPVNVMILSERDTGKTWGCLDHNLRRKGGSVAFIVNSEDTMRRQIPKVLRSLKTPKPLDEPDRWTQEDKDASAYYAKWTISGNFVIDEKGKPRIYFASVSTYYKYKGARDFLPRAIIYDEFNQNVKYVEQSKKRAKEQLDVITKTLRTKGFKPKHLYIFANKNVPATPILSCTLMLDLGITSLLNLNEITTIYRTIPDFPEFEDLKIPNTFLINSIYTHEEKVNNIRKMLKDYSRYDWDLDLLCTSDGMSTLFNDDDMDYNELIINTFGRSRGNPDFIKNNLHFEGWLATKKGDFLKIYTWKFGSVFKFDYHVLRVDEKPKKTDRVFVWGSKPYAEKQMLLSQEDKDAITNALYKSKISYEDVISRVDFIGEIL